MCVCVRERNTIFCHFSETIRYLFKAELLLPVPCPGQGTEAQPWQHQLLEGTVERSTGSCAGFPFLFSPPTSWVMLHTWSASFFVSVSYQGQLLGSDFKPSNVWIHSLNPIPTCKKNQIQIWISNLHLFGEVGLCRNATLLTWVWKPSTFVFLACLCRRTSSTSFPVDSALIHHQTCLDAVPLLWHLHQSQSAANGDFRPLFFVVTIANQLFQPSVVVGWWEGNQNWTLLRVTL